MAKGLGSVLFVSRLSFYTTNQELKRWFLPFGVVTEARLVKDQRTQRPKGFGFVTFESEVQAQKALKAMNGRIVGGRLIFVEVAETTRPEEHAKTARP
ncbi:hypothetical protein LguiA_020992 [Lonicera macranthoides]